MSKLSIILCSFLCFSCAIKVKRPTSRFIMAESQGELFKGHIGVLASSNVRSSLTFSGDRTDNPIENFVSPGGPYASGELGISKKLDFYAFTSLAQTPTVAGLKYQLLGPYRKEAKKGDFSIAMAVGVGYIEREDVEDRDIFGENNESVNLEESLGEGHLIFGYRASKNILAQIRFTYLQTSVKGKITQSDSAALLGKSFDYFGEFLSAHFDYIHFPYKKTYWRLELGSTSVAWSHSRKSNFGTVAFGLGFLIE